MTISHDANEIEVSGTETGDALRTYITANSSLGTVYDRTAILNRNIDITQSASFTDHDCTWIFPSTYHWDFSGKADLFELKDAVIVYTDDAKSHSSQPKAETLTLINVQYRIEGNTGRTDFFGAGTTIGFEFSNVQFITYGSGTNYLHLQTSGGLLENVAVKVGAGALAYQPDTIDNTTLILRNWTLDSSINLIQANGGASLDAITRLENLSWGKTIWNIGRDAPNRGQYYKVINPIKPPGWRFYKGSTDTTISRCDEFHTHNVRIVDEDNNPLSGFEVHLRRSDGTVVYELTTDSNGDIAEQEVMTYEQTGETGNHTGEDFTQYNGFSLAGVSYSNKLVTGIKNLADGRIDEVIGSFTDTTITDTKANADAYTEINTPEKFYDRAKAHLVDNFAGETATIVSREANSIDAGSYDVVVDGNVTDAASAFAISGNTLTIKATTFVGNISTTGTATLSNGAEVVGTFGSTTVLPWEIKNIEATSRVQLYNVTQDAEVLTTKLTGTAGALVDTGGTYTSSEIAVGDVVRLRVTCVVGDEAMLPLEVTGVATTAGLNFSIDQQADTIYNSNAIDGSAITSWTADFTNNPMGVDLSESDGGATVQEIYAFMVYSQTTADGVDKWFDVVRAIDSSNYQIDQAVADIKIQNRGSVAVNISGGRIFRKDGASVLYAEDGDKPLTLDTGALVANIKPQIDEALNTNAKINSTNNNTKLIPSLL